MNTFNVENDIINAKSKTCTICGKIKSIDNFYKCKYKPRKDGTQKVAFRSDCKECGNKMTNDFFKRNKYYKKDWRKKNPEKAKAENLRAKKRTDKWRKENKEILKIKRAKYRLKNIDRIKSKKPLEQKKAREELQDNYVIAQITKRSNLTSKDIRKYPELIKTKRIIIKTKRLCRTLQN